jgi:DNA-binding transcriptional MerR regulator
MLGGMDDGVLFTIGQLAERTGLSVGAIRFYSDSGLVPPSARSAGGYRLYDTAGSARLDLVRTLRELGLDLTTIRRVLDREVTLADVAQAHAQALAVQIRSLQLRRSVLLAVARREITSQEVELMNSLARQTAEERNRLINDFIDATFGGLDASQGFVAMMRSAMPNLPDDPSPEQVEAWVELADLVGDAEFRASVRRMAEFQAERRGSGPDNFAVQKELSELVQRRVGEALAAGVDPASAAARPVTDELLAAHAAALDGIGREALLERLEIAYDPQAERYWKLLGVINGWPERPSVAPVFAWFISALRASG